MVDLLVDLPIAPLAGILNTWLNARDVTRVDTAYCNRRCRPLLLQTLTASYAVQHAVLIAPMNMIPHKTDISKWMIKRNVKCVNLTCESNGISFAKTIGTLLPIAGPTIQSLTFKTEKQLNNCRENIWRSGLSAHLPFHIAEMVAECCPKLRTLNCKFVELLPLQVTNIVTNCKHLKVLNFTGCTKVPVGILNACSKAVHLEELDISGCSLTVPLERVDDCAAPVCPSVRKLSAMHTKLCESELFILLERFPCLTELSIDVDKELLDVAKVAKQCPLLEMCTIMNPTFVDKDAATVICNAWRSIRNLSLHYSYRKMVCSEEAIVVLIQQCLTLQSLQLFRREDSNCSERDAPVYEHAPRNNKLSQLVNLFCMPISAVSLQSILSVCPQLHFLHFLSPKNMRGELVNNEVMIEESLQLLQHSSIKVLTFQDCSLTALGLASVSNLTKMYIHNCAGDVTNNDLIKMTHRCPELISLTVERPPRNIDWNFVLGVLDECPMLRKLVFKGLNGGGNNAAGMEAFAYMIKRNYPHLCDVCLDF